MVAGLADAAPPGVRGPQTILANGGGEATEAPTPLTCQVFKSFAGLDGLREDWDDAVLRTGGSVYMTYDWVRVWWEFYGVSAELRLFVWSAGTRIVAVVPVYIDTLGWQPLGFRIARLVGANIPPKVFGLAVSKADADTVFDEVLTQLFVQDRCDLLSLGPVSALAQWEDGLEAVCDQRTDLVSQRKVVNDVHSVFHLPTNMEEYYAALSKNERKNRRKYELRLLKKEHDTRVEVVSDPALLLDEFERFAVQHRQQWFAEGRSGHFGAWPRALDFNRALVEAQGRLGRLRFIRILADGEVVSNQYTFAFGDRYYWELPARAVDSKWDRFSLGPTSIVSMLAEGIREGMTRVEGGLAHYDYKVRLGAKEYSTLTLRIVSSSYASRARCALYSVARGCVSIAFHKLWYRRIMPRLPPLFWRPQWRQWLRLDF